MPNQKMRFVVEITGPDVDFVPDSLTERVVYALEIAAARTACSLSDEGVLPAPRHGATAPAATTVTPVSAAAESVLRDALHAVVVQHGRADESAENQARARLAFDLLQALQDADANSPSQCNHGVGDHRSVGGLRILFGPGLTMAEARQRIMLCGRDPDSPLYANAPHIFRYPAPGRIIALTRFQWLRESPPNPMTIGPPGGYGRFVQIS